MDLHRAYAAELMRDAKSRGLTPGVDLIIREPGDRVAQLESAFDLFWPPSEPLLADQAVELENLANKYHKVDPEGHPRTGREYFKINSLKFERAISEGVQSGRPVKVFFHSHLDCGSYFSAEDAASMTMGNTGAPSYALAYLVTAVDKGEVSAHRLFIWDISTKAFVEAPFSKLE